jgi:serine/threonine protein kinase
VALKFVRLRDDPGGIEARALEIVKEVRHPNLLALFGAWRLSGFLVIGMELADGSLSDRLAAVQKEGAPGLRAGELIGYMEECAKGIDHLNEHKHTLGSTTGVGVQHRDIKPQNILLVGGGVKVADFGLARLLADESTGHTGSMTPAYAAPEFFQNRTSDRSDQYSLAVVYCHLRGGRLPFVGGVAAVTAGHLFRPPDLSMIPPREQPAVARALSKAPETRWPSCRAFVAALRAGIQIQGAPESAPAIAAASETVPSTTDLTPRVDPPRLHPTGSTRSGHHRDKTMPAKDTLASASTSTSTSTSNAPSTEHGSPSSGRFGVAPSVVTLAVLVGLILWAVGGRRPVAPGRFEEDRSAGRLIDPEQRGTEPSSRKGLPLNPESEVIRDHIPTITPDREPRPAADPVAGPTPQELAVAPFERGDLAFQQGDYDRSVAEYTEALRLTPHDAVAIHNRGNAHNKAGRFQNALADYDQAIALDPGNPLFYFNRGNLWNFALARYDKALDDYDHVLALDPADYRALMNRGKVHDKLGHYPQAQADIDLARRLQGKPTAKTQP